MVETKSWYIAKGKTEKTFAYRYSMEQTFHCLKQCKVFREFCSYNLRHKQYR